jgi:high-affinity Fe2+/Pb2+ permease
MARRRRRRDDPAEGVGGLLILGALWLWYKVGNSTFYVIIGSVFIITIGIIILLVRKGTYFVYNGNLKHVANHCNVDTLICVAAL